RHRRRGAEAALSGPAGLRPCLTPRLRAGARASGRAVDADEGEERQIRKPLPNPTQRGGFGRGVGQTRPLSTTVPPRSMAFRSNFLTDFSMTSVHFNKIALVGIGLIGS